MDTAKCRQTPGLSRSLMAGYLLGLLLIPGFLSAQGLTVNAIVAPINVLSFSDVDFVNSATPQWLFSVDINAGGRSIMAAMTVDLRVALATGEVFNPALHFVTRAFPVNGARTITNLDIGKGKTIRDSLNQPDQAAKKKLEDIALPSGQLPAGTYTFAVKVEEVPPNGPPGIAVFSIVLTNPSSVELLFPVDGDRMVSPLPLFQWVFDGARSAISVFEQLPEQTSLEESAQGVPQISQETATTSLQYPAAGVRPLQPGKTYVWFVEGHVRAPGGRDMLLKSPLRSFTVNPGPSAVSSLLEELERSLDQKYKGLFDQIRSEGLQLQGGARVNGAPFSPAELGGLLKYIRTHPDAIQSVGLE